jgi:hypothetical protein
MLPNKSTRREVGLLTNFKNSATKLLEDAERYVNNPADESIKLAFTLTLEGYKVQATQLQKFFLKRSCEKEGDSRLDRYMKAARTIGKGGRVESLIRGTLDDLQLLATKFPEVMTRRGKEQLAKAIEEVPKMEPSLHDGSNKCLHTHTMAVAPNTTISAMELCTSVQANISLVQITSVRTGRFQFHSPSR